MELDKILTGKIDKTTFQELLSEQFRKKTGIDLIQYRNEELVSTLADLLIFPKYAISKIAAPVLWTFAGLWIACLILMNFDGSSAFSLLVLGSILALPNGILLGILNFLDSLSADMSKILFLSLQTAKNILTDLNNLQSKIKEGEFELPKLSELIKGVIYVVILPSLSKVIQKKFPLIGNFVANLMERIVESLHKKTIESIEKQEKELAEKIEAKTENYVGILDKFCQKSIQKIDFVEEQSSNLVKKSIQMVSMPIRWFSISFLGVSSLFLLLMMWLFR